MSHTRPHDEFLELCAVSTSGQLTQEEQKKLQEHLAVCSSCREAVRQYAAIAAHAIPAMAADEVPDDLEPGSSWSQERAEAALFHRIAQADKAGIAVRGNGNADIPKAARQALPFAGESTWRYVWSLYAAGVLLAVALGVSLYQTGNRHGVDTAMFLLGTQTTFSLIQSYNTQTQYATADVLDSLWNHLVGTIMPVAAVLAVVGAILNFATRKPFMRLVAVALALLCVSGIWQLVLAMMS